MAFSYEFQWFVELYLSNLKDKNQIFRFPEKISQAKEMPTAFKVYWALHNISLIISFVVTIFFWGILYKRKLFVRHIHRIIFSRPFSWWAACCYEYIFTWDKFCCCIFGNFNCITSNTIVTCYSTDCFWDNLWIILVYLLRLRWRWHVSAQCSLNIK